MSNSNSWFQGYDSKENYLGSPLILGHSKKEAFTSIQESFEHRFSTYNALNLSQARKSTMIKLVLNSVPTYQMGTFKMPKQIITKLTSIGRKFFWGHHSKRGYNHVAWTNVCKPKDFGGLAFRDMESLILLYLPNWPGKYVLSLIISWFKFSAVSTSKMVIFFTVKLKPKTALTLGMKLPKAFLLFNNIISWRLIMVKR